MRIRVTVRDRQAITGLRGAERAVARGRRNGARKAAEEVARVAKRPNYGFTDRTGNLRRSIRADFPARDARGRFTSDLAASVVAGNRIAFYAPFVEYRWGGRYSYLRRALRVVEPRVGRIMEREVRDELKRARIGR